jgi:hypothetical protein
MPYASPFSSLMGLVILRTPLADEPDLIGAFPFPTRQHFCLRHELLAGSNDVKSPQTGSFQQATRFG